MANRNTIKLDRYEELIQFALDLGEGMGLADLREELSVAVFSESNQRRLMKLDGYVIEQITQGDMIADYLLEDDSTRPLTAWWWHLGKLRAGTYPVHLLPPHLREIYQPEPERLAA
ncbi:MAG TPA: hypothetical protein DCS21_12355 [Gammaproteobacteria bacterium]|nr:hypothetical protein [Gammaproteobacteria bacterium]